LLPGEALQGLRHRFPHGFHQGIPIRLQLLDAPPVALHDRQLAFRGLAGVLDLREPGAELFQSHQPGGLLVLVGAPDPGSPPL
jgi:hypothetical protein